MRSKQAAPPKVDPLAALLREAARKTNDPAVRRWLERLLRTGETAPTAAEAVKGARA